MAKIVARPGVELQARDIEILRGLFESRIMTAAHVAALYFAGRPEAAKKRLQKLKALGVIRERPRRSTEPAILFITRRGCEALESRGALADYPAVGRAAMEKRARVSELTVRHELEVMAVKAALSPAIDALAGLQVAEFSTWPQLFKFKARQLTLDRREVTVRPDGFIRIHEIERDGGRSEHTFFLEVDRSTEVQDTLVIRAGCYLDFYRSGGLAARYGQSRERFRDFPFRVLIVLRNTERRNNTAERLLQGTTPILTQVWLTTFEEITTQPLGAIWIRPADYREATAGTSFAPDRRRDLSLYRRQPEREALVEARIEKKALLAEEVGL